MKKPCPVPPDRAKIFYLGNAGLRPVFPFLSFMICIGALKALGLLRRPHKKCLRAVRHGPHFVLKHETTFFTPGSALRIRQVSLGWTRDSVSGLCQEPKAPGPRFAEVHSRETEPSSQGASAPRKENTAGTFSPAGTSAGRRPSSASNPAPGGLPGSLKSRGGRQGTVWQSPQPPPSSI